MHILNSVVDLFSMEMDLRPLGLDSDAGGGSHYVRSLGSSLLLGLIQKVFPNLSSIRILCLG